MPREHRVYKAAAEAIEAVRLEKPSSKEQFKKEYLGFSQGTCDIFLWKHRRAPGRENLGSVSELLEVARKGYGSKTA